MLEKVEVYVQVSFSLESGARGSRAEAHPVTPLRAHRVRGRFSRATEFCGWRCHFCFAMTGETSRLPSAMAAVLG